MTFAALLALPGGAAPITPAASVLARGRILVIYGTCNDCHTPGWRESDGKAPASSWMIGTSIGFRTASGTSYPANVRLDFQSIAQNQWIAAVRTRGGHPPMIWQDLRGLSDADLRSIYQFIRSLGPAGTLAPAAIPPWREPTTRFIDLRVQPAR